MLGLSADAYVLKSVTAVRANDLEQALLLLPFNDALRLMQRVSGWLKQGSQVNCQRQHSPDLRVVRQLWKLD
jgi:U3 small nucleolar RNA-associated protein 12